MSDNVNKEQQEAQMPSAQEEVVIEEVTEEDSTNETQEQEHTHEIDEPSSVFNALDSFLGKANGPNDWEEVRE
jgi:hypothetical protein